LGGYAKFRIQNEKCIILGRRVRTEFFVQAYTAQGVKSKKPSCGNVLKLQQNRGKRGKSTQNNVKTLPKKGRKIVKSNGM
jgi:hypothetical protein